MSTAPDNRSPMPPEPARGESLRTLPFTAVALLAPMEGVTDPSFRDLVLAAHDAADLGGAFTEFVRISGAALPGRVLRRHLGVRRFPQPVGLQLMGNEVQAMARTAERAVEAGAPLIDVNFGCPARGAQKTCAGSALLADPARIEGIVAALVAAVGRRVPVTAKIRAGVVDDRRLEDVARAVEAGGAALLTVHCRTRSEGYRDEAIDWRRITRAVESVTIPVCGNGGVSTHGDIERMRRETGCRFVMVGRAAIGDPWIFRPRPATRDEAASFLRRYRDRILDSAPGHLRMAAARLKQLIRYWTAAGLFDEDRREWLLETDPAALSDRLDALGEPEPQEIRA